MRCLLVFSLLQALVLVHRTQSTTPKNEIKALWNLGEVAECVLHYSPLVYYNYGCWCGFGGVYEPVDAIDSCCMDHDNCYGAAVKNKVCLNTLWQYLDNYKWKCTNGTAICDKKNRACQSALCACDVAFVNCLSQHPKPQERKKCSNVTAMPKHF